MAASALTPTQVTRSGTADTLTAANVDGNYYSNTSPGSTWFEVLNGDASPITVSVAALMDGVTVATFRQYTVAAGARKKIGPFPSTPYNDANSRVQITYSSVTSVTVGAFYI